MMAVVFDLDGTLIDSAPDIHAAVARMLTEEGAPALDVATVTSFVGNGLPKLVERAMRAVGLNLDRHPELSTRVLAYYDEENGRRTVLYPGAKECLAALHRDGARLGICTNKPEAPTHAVLKQFDLSDLFSAVVGGDTLPVRKPDAAPLLAAFKALNCDASAGVYVGDSEVDAATAQACAAPFALFENGYRKTPVTELAHTMSFSDFTDLETFIRAQSS